MLQSTTSIYACHDKPGMFLQQQDSIHDRLGLVSQLNVAGYLNWKTICPFTVDNYHFSTQNALCVISCLISPLIPHTWMERYFLFSPSRIFKTNPIRQCIKLNISPHRRLTPPQEAPCRTRSWDSLRTLCCPVLLPASPRQQVCVNNIVVAVIVTFMGRSEYHYF